MKLSLHYIIIFISVQVNASPIPPSASSASNSYIITPVTGKDSPGIISFDLTRHETTIGHSILNGIQFTNNNLPSQSNGSNTIINSLINQITHYTVNIGIGESNLSYPMLVDTGSSEFWVSNDTSLVDVPYNYAEDTNKQVSNTPFHIDYVRGSADGFWATNRFFFGHEITSMSYAIVYKGLNAPKIRKSTGILGISYSLDGRPNLPLMLKQDDFIHKNAYSLSLKDYQGTGGSLLFGGIDHSRYVGDLLSVPRVDYPDAALKTLSIALNSVTVDGNTINTSGLLVPLDSGTSFTYLPPDVYAQIAASFGIDDSKSATYGAPTFNVTQYGDKTVTFEFSGAQISVKGSDLAINFQAFNRPDHGDLKIFGIWSNKYSAGYSILGDTFLRSAYVVYDLDDDIIALGQANPQPGEPNIEPIINIIPGAKQAPGWVNAH